MGTRGSRYPILPTENSRREWRAEDFGGFGQSLVFRRGRNFGVRLLDGVEKVLVESQRAGLFHR